MRCRARLILSECCSLDLLRSLKWRCTLDYEMPSSPDTLRVLLTGLAEVVKMTMRTGLWDAKLAWYSRRTYCQIWFYGSEHSLGIYGFIPTWACLIIDGLATRAKPSAYCTVIKCIHIFRKNNVSGCNCGISHSVRTTFRVYLGSSFQSYSEWSIGEQVITLTTTILLNTVCTFPSAWTVSVTWYTRLKFALTEIVKNFWLTRVAVRKVRRESAKLSIW